MLDFVRCLEHACDCAWIADLICVNGHKTHTSDYFELLCKIIWTSSGFFKAYIHFILSILQASIMLYYKANTIREKKDLKLKLN